MTSQLFDSPEERIRRSLQDGEQLLWVGRPKQGLCLRVLDVGLIPFSLMWGGFAIFWEYSAILSNAPPFMKFWGVPFVLIGLYLIVGRFFVDAYVRRGIAYGLTDRRIIVVGGLWQRRTVSHSLTKLARTDIAEHRDGTGTIYLDGKRIGLRSMDWDRNNVWAGWSSDRLERIAEARAVYSRILELQALPSITRAATDMGRKLSDS